MSDTRAALPQPAAIRGAFYEELSPARRAGLLSWMAFTATFGAVRGITYSIRDGRGPMRNVTVRGIHVHHYMLGIGIVSTVGAMAVAGWGVKRHHSALAIAYGAGLALIVDEFAPLLDLEDVYWARQGRVSVDVAVGLIASAGSFLAGLPLWRRLREDQRLAQQRG